MSLPAASPPASARTVFFLSDYGLTDEFVGVVHAVIQRAAPGTTVIDLTHAVPPFDIRAGTAALIRARPALGPGVVLAVVDPGVGGGRRALALETPDRSGPRFWVGPDNGLLLGAAEAAGPIAGAVELSGAGPDCAGAHTFDGRDVFAPAAAALVGGAPLSALGPALDPQTLVRALPPVIEWGTLPDGRSVVSAEVSWVDRFGNVALALATEALPELDAIDVDVGGGTEPAAFAFVRSFSDLDPGQEGVLGDANGAVALVVAQGSAAERFGLAPGALVCLMW